MTSDRLTYLIEACQGNDAKAQQEMFDSYKSVLFGICRRYVQRPEDAEDIFIVGMVKVFEKINDFKGDGSFEGWMKKIMVNECLMHLRKKDVLQYATEIENIQFTTEEFTEARIDGATIVAAFELLPPGYRTVLNLYEIEGYKHREIAELLKISINTSKSQLILAKKKLQEILKNKLDIHAA